MQSEKATERYLIKHIKNLEGKIVKMRPIENGYPDRLCVLPGPVFFFVEIKSEGEEPEPLQEEIHKELRDLGCNVFVVHTKTEVDYVIKLYLNYRSYANETN